MAQSIIQQTTHAIRDLFVRILPYKKAKPYGFAFLVHPRDIADVSRKYPIFRYFPEAFTSAFTRMFWPVVLSEVTGLKSESDGRDIPGWVITIPLTPHQMIENRQLAVKRIIQAAKLAHKMGTRIVGLGALTSSISKGGLDLIGKVSVNITTGHAYTAYNVTRYLFELAEKFKLDKKKVLVAIVGASGSVGSMSAKLLAREGYNNILLIDLPRKTHHFEEITAEMKKLNLDVKVGTSHQIRSIKNADLIIAATNAPEALIREDDLKPGAIIVDDAQPSDVSPEVLDRDDVLAIEAGVVHTPGIKNNFNFELKEREDNFCCMAELLLLAHKEWGENYVINRATLEHVDEMSKEGIKLGFRPSKLQNFKELISNAKIEHIKYIIANRE